MSSNIGKHSQGPCKISHLHNSLAFTEVRPRFYRRKQTQKSVLLSMPGGNTNTKKIRIHRILLNSAELF